MIGAVHRRIVAGRAVAAGDEPDNRRAVDRQRQRLAHPHIAERLLVAAHVQVQELAGRRAQRHHALAACEARIFRGGGAHHQVGVARDQRRGFGGVVGIDHYLHAIEIGARRIVEIRVALHHHAPVGFVGNELERSGADGALGELVQIALRDGGRDDLRIRVSQRHREVRVRCRQLEHRGVVVLGHDLGDRADIGAPWRGGLRVEDRGERGGDVLRRAGRAVVEAHAPMQFEAPFRQIGIGGPGCREIRLGRHLRAEAREAAVEQLGHQIFRVYPRAQRIEHTDGLVDRNPQHAAAARRCGVGQLRQ
jgi:hypothetical protein